MKKGTLVFACICAFISLIYLIQALQYPMGAENKPGPGVFPLFAGSLLLLGALGSIWVTLAHPPAGKMDWPKGKELVRVIAIAVAALIYAYGVEFLGHIIATLIVTLTCLHAMGMRSWLLKIVTALLIAFGSYYLFSVILSSPLPKGLLEGVL